MKQKLLCFFLVCVTLIGSAYAQERRISGRVTSAATGDPLAGVSVYATGTNTGVSTNANGGFDLNLPSDAKSLTVRYIGYTTRVVPLSGSSTVNITLESENNQLTEVVVTGYGITQEKRNSTGATSSIRASDIEGTQVQTLDGIMQGRAGGVQVTSTGGQPGGGFQVRIRGNATINGSKDPLYVIDGVPVSPGGLSGQTSVNALGSINPDDIESIEVLKDAASASIYGSQAGNGVVIVTTKKGKAGNTKLRASAQFGSAKAYNPYKVVNATDWLMLRRESLYNYYASLGLKDAAEYTEEDLMDNYFGGEAIPSVIPNYNWVDAVLNTGKNQDYTLSATGGDAKTRFYISGNYNDVNGTVRGSAYERGNLRANVSHNVNSKLTIDASLSLTAIGSTGPTTDAGFYTNGAFTGGLFTSPINPVYNDDGTYNEDLVGTSLNIVQNLDRELRKSGVFETIDNMALTYSILPELSFRAFGGIEFTDTKDRNYRPSDIPVGAGVQGSAAENFRRNINWNTSGQFNYSKSFNEIHNLSAVGGFEFRSVDRTVLSAASQGFASPSLTLLSSGATPTSAGSTFDGYKLASYFGNIKYDYKAKYLLDGTIRYDGSSRFGANKKWGLFYGLSGGWRISGEDFMKEATFVNDLKLRASYGKVGVQPDASFGALGLYGGGGRYNGLPGIRPSQLANPNLTWEQSAQVDLGLDFSLFNNRFSGSFDIYRKNNDRLLLDRDLPGDSGFGSIFENAGKVRAEGIDVELSSVNFDTQSGFKWSTTFNIGFTRNKLLELNEGQEQIQDYTYEVGKPLDQLYVLKYAGVNPADGRPMFYDKDNNITYSPVNDDQRVIGDMNADFFGGFSNSFSYKGFSLDVFFQYEYGKWTLMQTNQALEGFTFADNNVTDLVLTRWTTPGQITGIPRLYEPGAEPGGYDPSNFTSKYAQPASYIRLKQVRLSYGLPASFVNKLKISGASLFIQGSNLATITNFRGDDPEFIDNNLNKYPNPRTITGGITLDL